MALCNRYRKYELGIIFNCKLSTLHATDNNSSKAAKATSFISAWVIIKSGWWLFIHCSM